MTLSRIWAAFFLLAIGLAGFKAFVYGDRGIFQRMVTGKADDAYDTVRYYVFPSRPVSAGFAADAAAAGWVSLDSPTRGAVYVNGPDWLRYERATVYSESQARHLFYKRADGLIPTTQIAVTLSIGLVGIMAFFMGLMSIAEQAGGIRLLARAIQPFFGRLFPGVPKGHPAFGHMMMNFSANLMGLDNAATPFGLKAMESLQELNPDKERASDAQLMFLSLHASGLTLIPVSIIAAGKALGAKNPTDIFVPCMIATFVATITAMMIVAARQRIRLLQPVILAWIGGLSVLIALLVTYLARLPAEGVQSFSSLLSNGLILLIVLAIILGGLWKKINLFDAFVEGAKEGFATAVRIIPYLVGMLAAIALLRASGAFDAAIQGMKAVCTALGADTRFVDGLPTALIKPLSGSGARGMMVDTIRAHGPDSFAGKLACLLQGSSDTTFYVVAVYFGAVAVRNTRYAVGAMLLADLAGIITAVLMCYLFFGGLS